MLCKKCSVIFFNTDYVMTYICGTYLSLQNTFMYPCHAARMSPRMIHDIRHEVLTMIPRCLVNSCQCFGGANYLHV